MNRWSIKVAILISLYGGSGFASGSSDELFVRIAKRNYEAAEVLIQGNLKNSSRDEFVKELKQIRFVLGLMKNRDRKPDWKRYYRDYFPAKSAESESIKRIGEFVLLEFQKTEIPEQLVAMDLGSISALVGEAYAEGGDAESAIRKYKKALYFQDLSSDLNGACSSHVALAKLYEMTNNPEQRELELKQIEELYKRLGLTTIKMNLPPDILGPKLEKDSDRL